MPPWSGENDKATVVALREIAKGTVTAAILDAAPVVRVRPTVAAISEQDILEEVIGLDEEDDLFVVSSASEPEAVEEVEHAVNLLPEDEAE